MIILTRKGQQILVDGSDYEYLSQFTWYVTSGRTPVVRGVVNKKEVSMHRLLMSFPIGLCVDHINGNTLDNRRENLRVCTNAENSRNRKKHGGSHKVKGVYKVQRSKNWRAKVTVNGRQLYSKPLPYNEAVLEYNRLAIEHFGEFARLNPIDLA